MPFELCPGCLRPSRAHRYDSATMLGTCGVCRKERVTFVSTGKYSAIPDRHYVRKRDPRLPHTKKKRGSRNGRRPGSRR